MITIVSGLPRSGTSMMMRMLDAGGMPILTDGERKADLDNPQGYYEFEQVKQLAHDKTWLANADGKAVKVVSLLLYDLPTDLQYKVIFMERKMEEILASQARMLQNRNVDQPTGDAEMYTHFDTHLRKVKEWLCARSNLSVHYCKYNDVVAHPSRHAEEICRFLDVKLDVEAMACAVRIDLYRQRK